MSTRSQFHSKAQPVAHILGAPRAQYGLDNEALASLLKQHETSSPVVELVEAFMTSPAKATARILTDVDVLEAHLNQEVPSDQILRILNVSHISASMIQLLGCKYSMDYELWTNRVQGSDREWFAGPLLERGAREFSHFNLACVDFQRVTASTPSEYMENRKLSHTVRLASLIDPTHDSTDLSRIFVLRRIAGHLRRDGRLWTFIYFNDPYVDLNVAQYVMDIPGGVQHPLQSWMTEFVNGNTPEELLKDLSSDGFGLALRVLREVKSTWKLLLGQMEVFLETLTEESTDEQLMNSAPWLHRRFLLNIDHIQHQLRYHRRYVTYLANSPLQKGLCIVPTIFKGDLVQESDALLMVDQRLAALRDRTTAILETVLNLNTIRHAELAAEMTRLQREDSRIAIAQGETLKRLTLVNMVFLPPTFVATLFSMNNAQYPDGTAWTLKSFIWISSAFLFLTMLLAAWNWKDRPKMTLSGGNAVPNLQHHEERILHSPNKKERKPHSPNKIMFGLHLRFRKRAIPEHSQGLP